MRIDCREFANKMKNGNAKGDFTHGKSIAIIHVGNDPASETYIKSKKKMFNEYRISVADYSFPYGTSETDVKELIKKLNADDGICAILVQLPLPNDYDERAVIDTIDPKKDVDGLTSYSKRWMSERLYDEDDYIFPCTPLGIMEFIRSVFPRGIDGKTAVVIGRSDLVGYPLAHMLLRQNATVVMCHSFTKNLKELCRMAEIIVVAIGCPKFLTADYIGDTEPLVIDVGINRLEDGSLCGDVDTDAVVEKGADVTTVPNGVGRLTTAALLENFFTLYNKEEN